MFYIYFLWKTKQKIKNRAAIYWDEPKSDTQINLHFPYCTEKNVCPFNIAWTQELFLIQAVKRPVFVY